MKGSGERLEMMSRLSVAVAEVGLYSRMCAESGIRVTLDMVRRRTVHAPDGFDVIVWTDSPMFQPDP